MCGSSAILNTYFPSLATASLFLGGEREGKNEAKERVFVDGLEVAHIRENCHRATPTCRKFQKIYSPAEEPYAQQKGEYESGGIASSICHKLK